MADMSTDQNYSVYYRNPTSVKIGQTKTTILQIEKENLKKVGKKILENPGIDPGTSRMLSERSTI